MEYKCYYLSNWGYRKMQEFTVNSTNICEVHRFWNKNYFLQKSKKHFEFPFNDLLQEVIKHDSKPVQLTLTRRQVDILYNILSVYGDGSLVDDEEMSVAYEILAIIDNTH